MGPVIGERMGSGFCWRFGRRSYEDMLAHWNHVGGTFKDGLNNARKYVASSNPHTQLPWPNSTLLAGDVVSQVAAPREMPGGKLVIMGSGQLIQSRLPHGLIDQMILMIHPIVLGSATPNRRSRRGTRIPAGQLHADRDRGADGDLPVDRFGILKTSRSELS